MRNHPRLRFMAMARAASTASLLAVFAVWVPGCGDNVTAYSVQGKTLTVMEQTYGLSGPGGAPVLYCQPLDQRGQYQVFIADVGLCSQFKNKTTNTTVFHSSDETNMRLIFPSSFIKNPNGTFKPNPFAVGKTGLCKQNVSGGSAVAVFAHNTAGQGIYDVQIEADTGTITVTDFSSIMSNIKGTFDLTFGADHITGVFDAFPCTGGISPDYGK